MVEGDRAGGEIGMSLGEVEGGPKGRNTRGRLLIAGSRDADSEQSRDDANRGGMICLVK